MHPNYRRRGIATKLLHILFEVSKRLGYSRVRMKTHKGHQEMIEFSRKEGFVEVKRVPGYWGGDEREAIFLERDI